MLYENRYGDILNLAKVANEATPHRGGAIDKLRELVVYYLVYQATKVVGTEACLVLVDSNSEFMRDIVTRLLSRLDP